MRTIPSSAFASQEAALNGLSINKKSPLALKSRLVLVEVHAESVEFMKFNRQLRVCATPST